jgi:hypothetical protein
LNTATGAGMFVLFANSVRIIMYVFSPRCSDEVEAILRDRHKKAKSPARP